MSSDKHTEFLERLARHPELYERVKELLEIVENAEGDALTADAAEELVVQEMRQLGQEALQAWAIHKQTQVAHQYATRLGMQRRGKKKLYWLTRLGRIEVIEQLFSRPQESNHIYRPFAHTAQVTCRGYSLGLERVVTDLAADCSFGQAVEKVAEHYGMAVSQSTVRVIAESHGLALSAASSVRARMPATGVSLLVAELDGSHVPCVEYGAGAGDKRKRRVCCWHEAKLCLARVVGSATTRYAATMKDITEAGMRWRTAAIDAGAGRNTRLHCVGDGAPSIAAQVKEQFGRQAAYLLDFFHVSEYLAAAGQSLAATHAHEWLREKQAWLKENRAAEVIAELSTWREAEGVAEVNAPVRKAWRYLNDRRAYLDYQRAIAAGLPIGSGEIEGGHRSVVQARLKKSGTWWLKENAEKMLALRVCRANGEWKSYWQQLRQAHA